MLKYKQIWHRIKPIRLLIKFNLTNPMVDFSKFASNNKLLSVVISFRVTLGVT